MTSSDYIFISAAVVAVAAIAALAVPRPAAKKETPRETTRWKRFRIAFAALHGDLREAAVAVIEEPSGLKLLAAPRQGSTARRLILLEGGERKIEVTQGGLFRRRRFRVALKGADWLFLHAPGPGGKNVGLEPASPRDACQVQGDLAGREYEVRRCGRLIASVSWQKGATDELARKDYVLECLKTEDPLPWIALAVGIEVAVGGAGVATASARAS